MENKLMKWRLPCGKERFACFSHVASHPKDVEDWVVVSLPEFPQGESVLFDQRSCEAMHGKDIELVLNPVTNIIMMVRVSRG